MDWSLGKAWAAFGLILIFHLALLLNLFGGPSKLTSDEPIMRLDHGYHFHYAVIGAHMLLEHGTSWFYDPDMMAGYPVALIDRSDDLIKLGIIALHGLGPEAAYKVSTFCATAMEPLLLFLAALWFCMGRREAVWSSLIGTWLWWAGGAEHLLLIGMTSYALIICYGMALAALFGQTVRHPSPRLWLGLMAAAPFALFIHPLIVVIIGPPCAVFYLLHFRGLSARHHIMIAAIAALSIILNLFWILPIRFVLPYMHTYHNYFQDGLKSLKILALISISKYQIVFPFLAAAGSMGIVRSYPRQPETRLALGAAVLTLGGTVFLGKFLPLINDVEPARYLEPLLFYLALPAAISVDRGWTWKLKKSGRRIGRALLTALFVPSLVLLAFMEFSRPVRPPFVGMSNQVKSIISFLSSRTSPDARVMLQDNGPLFGGYPMSHAASTIATYSHRQLVGGPHWATPFLTHYVDFSYDLLFDRPVSSWDEKPLRRMMDIYNVGWAGAYTPQAQALFNKFPEFFTPYGKAGDFRFYKLNREHTFFIEGSGLAVADYEGISLRNVRAPSGRAVISFHWHPRMVARPPADLVPVMIGDDPVGFIGIIDPPSSLEITVRYW